MTLPFKPIFSLFTVDLMPQRKRGFTLWNMVGSNVPVHPLLGTVFSLILVWMTRIWASTASLAKALSGICFRQVVSALAAQVRKPAADLYIRLLAGKSHWSTSLVAKCFRHKSRVSCPKKRLNRVAGLALGTATHKRLRISGA